MPDFFPNSDIDEPKLKISNYKVTDNIITVEFVVTIDYWASEYSMNRTKIKGEANFTKLDGVWTSKSFNYSIDSISEIKRVKSHELNE